jgi:hypothetical protein
MASAAAAPTIARELGSCSGSADDLGFVEETFGKQRPDRTIDQAAGENFFFGGTPLAFDKTARDLAGGVGVLAIVDGEREKTGSRFGLIGHASGDQNDRVTGTNDNGAVRLFGHLTGFKGNLTAIQINFNCVKHSSLKPPTSAENQSRPVTNGRTVCGGRLRLELTG